MPHGLVQLDIRSFFVLYCPMPWPPTVAEELRNDVRFGLGWKVGKKLRPLTDTERDMVAAVIVEHIRLCNWKVERGPPWGGFELLLPPPCLSARCICAL